MTGTNTTLSRRLSLHHELDDPSGVRVQSIERGSPAEAAGLESGDLIVSYDHEPATSIDRLQQILDFRRIDQPCENRLSASWPETDAARDGDRAGRRISRKQQA